MESIMEYTNVWAVYLAAGLIGLWCWGRMAFWVKHYGVIYHLYSALGAVLIFTPVPVTMDSAAYLAPGFLAVAVALLSHDQTLLNYYGIWYLITLVLALITVAGCSAAGLMPKVNTVRASQASDSDRSESAQSKQSRQQREASKRVRERASERASKKVRPESSAQSHSGAASRNKASQNKTSQNKTSARREPRL